MRVWRHAAWLGTPITACAMAAGDPPPSGQRVDPENSPEIAVDGGLGGESGSGGGKLEPPLADASWGGSEAPDAACAEIATSDVEPEIFVQLDRSCAMLHGGTSMWAVAVASLTTFSDGLTKHQ